MLRKLAAVATLLLLFVPLSARADPVPGDACATAQQYFVSAGPELGGAGHLMVCQGGTWKGILNFDNAAKVGFGIATPADPFHFVGTQMRIDNDTNATDKGCIRFDGATNKLQFSHDCTTYSDMGSGGGGGAPTIQVFTSNGTWNRPAGVTSIQVYVTGSGGGGGGTSFSNPGGSGGGAGGTAICMIDVTSITSAAVVVGAAGAAGAANSNGGNGNTSSFNGAGCSASGGSRGLTGSSVAGGAGGTGSGGNINLAGGGGGISQAGYGGSSYWGGGGKTAINSAGNPGNAYGSGGSGGNSNGSVTGGAGAPGIVVVHEYYGSGGGGGGGSTTLAGLTDVDVTGAANGNCLVYNNTSGKWEDSSCGAGGSDNLGNHTATQALNMDGFAIINSATINVNPAGTANIELGTGATANKYAFIDLVGDTTYSDYGLRIIRGNTGANTTSGIEHRGTGDFVIATDDAAALKLSTNSTTRLTINSAGAITATGSVTASSFSGNGSALANLNASNLATGTVGTARLGSGTANNTTYLRGDGQWAAPSGGGITSSTSATCNTSPTAGCTATCPAGYLRSGCFSDGSQITPSGNNACSCGNSSGQCRVFCLQ